MLAFVLICIVLLVPAAGIIWCLSPEFELWLRTKCDEPLETKVKWLWSVVVFFRRSMAWWSSFFAGCMFGLLIGLSRSPVLGLALTGVFGVATAIATALQGPKRPYYLTADVLRSMDRRLWQVSLGIILGAYAGMYLRETDLTIRRYRQMGFSDHQIQAVIDHQANEAAGKYRNLYIDLIELGFSKQQATDILQRHAVSISLKPTRRDISAPSSSQPKTDNKLGTWSGGFEGWFKSFVRALRAIEDPGSNDDDIAAAVKRSQQAQFKNEILHIRSLLHELVPTPSDSDQSEPARYRRYFDALHTIPAGETFLKHRDAMNSETESLITD